MSKGAAKTKPPAPDEPDLPSLNDAVVRLGIFKGSFHWHEHDEQDEMFMVLERNKLVGTMVAPGIAAAIVGAIVFDRSGASVSSVASGLFDPRTRLGPARQRILRSWSCGMMQPHGKRRVALAWAA